LEKEPENASQILNNHVKISVNLLGIIANVDSLEEGFSSRTIALDFLYNFVVFFDLMVKKGPYRAMVPQLGGAMLQYLSSRKTVYNIFSV